MNEQAIKFRFGVFVLTSLILLAVLTLLFGGFPNYFKRTDSFTIVFANGQGIGPGTPVKRSGVRIGEVRTIVLDDATGKVTVGIRIDGNYTLRKGDRPTLVQSILGGEAAIAFLPPDDPRKMDTSPVEPGTEMEGVNPPDVGTIVQKASDIVEPLNAVLTEVRKTFIEVNKLAPLAGDALKDFRTIGKAATEISPDLKDAAKEISLLAKSARETFPTVKETIDEIKLTARYWGKVGERADLFLKVNESKIEKSIDQMELALKRVNTLLGDDNQKYVRDILKDTSELIRDSRVTVKQVNDSLKKAEEAIGDLQKAMKPLGERGPAVIKNLDDTLKDVRELMTVIGRSDGTVQKLLLDPSLYNNLNDSAVMVTRILPRLDRILRDVETFSDKIARHPELLGIRGAIAPSSGIKESPPPYRTFP